MANRIRPHSYNDGVLYIYKICNPDKTHDEKYLKNTGIYIRYTELSVTDKLRSQMEANSIEVTAKLRIPQYKEINSNCVVKIDDIFYKVYNVYHFMDSDGFKQTDITLLDWSENYEEVGIN